MKARLALNTKNYGRICGLNGLRPKEVPAKIGRHRDTVYRALRNPEQFGPTIDLLNQLLPVRTIHR